MCNTFWVALTTCCQCAATRGLTETAFTATPGFERNSHLVNQPVCSVDRLLGFAACCFATPTTSCRCHPAFQTQSHATAFWPALFFEQPKFQQTFGRSHDGFFVGAGRPVEQAAGLCVGGVLGFAQLGQDLLHGRVAQRGEPHQPVGQLPRGDAASFLAPRLRFSTVAMSSIDMKSPDTARNRSPLAAGRVMARKCKSATSRTSTAPK